MKFSRFAASFAVCATCSFSLSACGDDSSNVSSPDNGGNSKQSTYVESCKFRVSGDKYTLNVGFADWSLSAVVSFDETTVNEEYVLDGKYGNWSNRICEVVDSNDDSYECFGGKITGEYSENPDSRKFFKTLKAHETDLCSQLLGGRLTLDEILF